MRKGRHIQELLWSAVVAWIALALCLTLQNGTETATTSGMIANAVHQMLMWCGIKVQYSELHQALRVSAHFIVFGVLGVLFEAAILASARHKGRFKSIFMPLLISMVLAVIPEVMKLWIPGCHLQWNEVLFNAIGAYGGVLLTYGLWKCRSGVDRN